MIRIKTTLLAGLTLTTLLAFPRVALADFLANSGSGGYYDKSTHQSHRYEYEVWSDDSNAIYTLKVWDSQDYPNGSPHALSSFKSAREALDYFDCYYARKQDICKQMR